MPTEIELTPSSTRMLLAVYREGKPTHRDKFDPVSARARKRIAREWDVEEDTFSDWCEQARVKGGAVKFTVETARPATPGYVLVRPIDAPRTAGLECKASPSQFVKTILSTVPVEHVAEWEGGHALVCLDVDYHDHNAPDREWLITLVTTRLAPKPLGWHFSRSGGLHLFYVAAGAFTAEELAACAALRFRSIDATAGLELKTVVRGPGSATVEHYDDQDAANDVVSWLGAPEYEEADRDEWLEAHDMECGRRYEHDKCPIDPSPGAEREPVLVGETGVYCFRCNGKGLVLGSRRAGFAPWSALLGSPSAGELGGMVRRLVHWGHARWVLVERYGLPADFARLAYSAALKAYHEGRSTEKFISRVFDERTEGLARVNDVWMTIDESFAYPREIQNILSCLPVTLYEDDGKVKSDPAVICEINQPKGITRYGYRNISVVHGYRLAARFLPDGDQTTVAVLAPALARVLGARRLPRYVPVSRRMSENAAWDVIERVLPRIDRTYIKVMIASFGCAQETMMGLPPVMYVSGVSAAGKTAMAQVASAVIGAQIGNETKFDADETRFRAGVRQGAQEGPVVVINELLKDAGKGRWKLTAREALDFVLTVTPNSASHMLYKGPVKMGRLPSIVLTETVCPDDLREETQLARRIRHHYVSGRKDEWKKTIAAAGLSNLHMLRTVSDAVAAACDAVMSTVIDECFAVPDTWDAIADRYGVRTIEDSTDFTDMTPWLRELFRLICAAPELTGREARLNPGGYKRIARAENTSGEDESDLSSVYGQFATPGNWSDARKLHEKDWGRILDTTEQPRVDVKVESPGVIYMRFCVGPIKKPLKVNSQIVDSKSWKGLME